MSADDLQSEEQTNTPQQTQPTSTLFNAKPITVIIKELAIPPLRKLNIFIDPKPIKEPTPAYNYYTYLVKDMTLKGPNGIKKIAKQHIPQQIVLTKLIKNIYDDNSDTVQLIYDTTPKTYKKGNKSITYYPFTYDFL